MKASQHVHTTQGQREHSKFACSKSIFFHLFYKYLQLVTAILDVLEM